MFFDILGDSANEMFFLPLICVGTPESPCTLLRAGPTFARIPLLKRIAAIDFYSFTARGEWRELQTAFFMGRFIILRENIPRCKSRATSLASRYTNSTRGGLFKLGQRHRESAHFDLSMSRESCLALPFISRKIRARHLSMMLLPVVCPLYLSSSDPTVQFFLSRKEMGRQRRRLSSSSCRKTN